MTLTPKMLDGLRWFAENGPIGWSPLDGSAPTKIVRRRLQAAGFVEECGLDRRESGIFGGAVSFQITDAGRAALEGHQ